MPACKAPHVVILCLIGLASPMSGLMEGYAGLLAARMVMGLLEGPILPLTQTLVALESTDSR